MTTNFTNLNPGQKSLIFKPQKADLSYHCLNRDSVKEAEWHFAKVKREWRRILGQVAIFKVTIE